MLERPLKARLLHFTLDHLMVLQNYMLIGLLLIIVSLTIFLHVMEFCLTMNLQEEVKHLLQERLHELCHELNWVHKSVYI